MRMRWRDDVAALVGGLLVLGALGAVVVPRALGDDGAVDAPPGATMTPTPTAAPSPTASSSPATTVRLGGILVMWVRAGLPPGAAARAAELPGVEAVAYVRSGTLGLVGSRAADGTVVDELEDGRRIPVAAVAVDPVGWHAVVGADGGPATDVPTLRPGTVLLSESGAELRGIGAGGTIDLDGLPGLEVVGVVPDDRTRGAEVVLHVADADRAGVRERGSLVVRHGVPEGPEADRLVAELSALAPEDRPARVVPGDRAGYRAPLVLSLTEVKRAFGEFWYRPRPGAREIDIEPAFVDDNIVTAEVPILGRVRCHRDIVADLRAALTELVDTGLADTIDPDAYAGCFYPRRIDPDRDNLSHHSWGIALDINVDLSAPGLGPPPPEVVVEVFGGHGFRWGGDFLQPDNHHFEWLGSAAAERPRRTP